MSLESIGLQLSELLKATGRTTKTIQAELREITTVAADVQSISAILPLARIKAVAIFIDHAKDNALASAGQGAEYAIQVAQKALGNDNWIALQSFTATVTVPVAPVTDAEEVAGATVIECGAVVPAVGDIVFFKNSVLADSEWANVIARSTGVGTETFTLENGLNHAQNAGTYYTQGERWVIVLDVRTFTRLRVVCNNTKGTTNRAIVWRCAAITYSEQ